MKRLLLIEDTKDSTALVTSAGEAQFVVTRVTDARTVFSVVSEQKIDLILLDIAMSEGDGFELLIEIKNFKASKDIPVVILSERATVEDKVKGLSLGAEDYIVVPFEPHEFKARLESRIRFFRTSKESSTKKLKKGRLELDSSMGRCFCLNEDGVKQEISLTPHEFRLLSLFIQSDGTILSRNELMKNIWGENTFVLPRTVDRHVSSLRSKIDPRCGHLDAVHGVGYRFELNQ